MLINIQQLLKDVLNDHFLALLFPHTECLCIYGTCDNQIDSDGICLAGSCKSGYAGKLCDKQVFPCGTFLQFCHAHADCLFKNGAMR